MEVRSIAKKFKTPAFASGCSRDVIRRGAELLEWSLDELFANTLEAMKSVDFVQ
jgi:predicted hydrolase (HD superfamily)